jgi:hypothetical protein
VVSAVTVEDLKSEMKLMYNEGQCTYNVTLRHVYETIVALEKQENFNISVCARGLVCGCAEACALLTPHTKRVRCVMSSSMA